MIRLTTPLALLFLLVVPVVLWIGWPAPGFDRRRQFLSLGLRLLILSTLILALAGIAWVQPGDKLAVVFLLDTSDSMTEAAQQAALDFIRQSLVAMGPDDQAALIVFGGDAWVERGMSSSHELGDILSTTATNQTDLEQALRLAIAIFPSDASRRLVILSDGAATTGDAIAAARMAAAAGIEIVVVPFINTIGDEALVSQVDLPAHLTQGESFFLDVTIQATTPTPALIRILSRDIVIYEGQTDLRRGEQTYSLPLVAGNPGFTDYQVQVIPEADSYYQNNSIATFSNIAGPPRILLVAPPSGESLGFPGEIRPDEFSYLLRALQSAGFSVDTARPSGMPAELSELVSYASVVLVDVPARHLNQHQMDTLQSYVRDIGGGLVTVGGPTSYGVGGYFHTPFEEMLPVDVQIRDQQRRPSLAIVFIIDHSGSMAETGGGVNKLALAKEAAIRSVQLLFPTDRVGVIAFDDAASWVVPMTDLSEPQDVINGIGSIQIGGGTDILAGLQAMAQVLPGDPALVRHVILLTDGGADPTGIPELVSQLNTEHGITLTTVGVGRDAAPYLADLAVMGGGRYHFTADPSTIPAIFTEETSLATRAYVVEESFFPELNSYSPILAGIDSFPSLAGYVGTSAKETAQTILVSHLGDPLLASWQYGLGRVVSFTSDATGRWAQSWLTWNDFPIFWGQVIESTLGVAAASPLELRVERSGEDALLIVEARNSDPTTGVSEEFLNNYQVQANIVSPGGNVNILTLVQVAPGQYQASFKPDEQGTYLIQLSGQPPNPDDPPISGLVGWVQEYSPEYLSLDSDPDALIRVAMVGGGRLASDMPAEIFDHTLTPPKAIRPAWSILLFIAAVLLPVDIAVRRLVITRQDWLTLIAKVRSSLDQIRSRKQPGPIDQLSNRPDLQIAKLRILKKRQPLQREEGKADNLQSTNLPSHPEPVRGNPLTDRSDSGETETAGSATPKQSTASRLLARKRARRESSDDKSKAS